MGYEWVQNGNTQFAIDWDIVRRILKSYWIAKLQYDYGQVVTLSDSNWYNPLSYSLPDISHIEVDWDQVQRDAAGQVEGDLATLREYVKSNAAGVGYKLEDVVYRAASYKNQFVDWMGSVQTDNMHAINKAVEDYESKIEISRFVRDTSAEGLMVGASVMSGGAAVGVMGAGSFLKGEGKFQDSGSVGAGVMEGVGSFVFAYVKLGKKFSFKEDMVLAMVQGEWKADTELVGGASVGKAALSGALKLTGPAVDRAFKIGPMKTIFDKVAVPIVITYDGKNVASDVLSKFGAKMVQKQGIEKAGKNFLLGLGSSSTGSGGTARPRGQGGIIDQTTLTNTYLLYLGYVNMNNGIGRGW